MAGLGSRFVPVNRDEVLTRLRAVGTRDPDVLYAQKLAWLETASGQRMVGTIMICAGGVATVTVILALVSIPVLLAGLWLRWQGATCIAAVETAFAEFLSQPGP